GLRIYLYHIPPVSSVPITLTLIERLLKAYPGTIAGAKDSSGDWNNTKAMLDQFAKSGFDVFPGAETFLLAGLRSGGAGCISATANTNAAAIARLYDTWRGADADAQQKRLDEIRGTFAKYPMIPALKAAIAHWSGIAEWATVRPPLVALTREQAAALVSDLRARNFDMPRLRGWTRRQADHARDRHTLPSRPHRQRLVAHRALAGRPLVHADGVAGRGVRAAQPRRCRPRPPRGVLPAQRHRGRGDGGDARAGQSLPRARGRAALCLHADRRRRDRDHRRPAVARDHGARPLARARVPLVRRPARA